MKRRLAAALACRNNGSRLYGKPLQILPGQTTSSTRSSRPSRPSTSSTRSCSASPKAAPTPFVEDVARAHGVSTLFGDPHDVLERLVLCGRRAEATDVFRVTTECPWFAYDMLEPLWKRHVDEGNDITVCDRLPEGLHFEIYTLEALERSHARGSARDRSEFCSNYARTHRDEFRIAIALPPKPLQRLDLRVTIDNPEDLVLCRAIAAACADAMPRVPVERIVAFLDSRPDLQKLVAPYVVPAAGMGANSGSHEAHHPIRQVARVLAARCTISSPAARTPIRRATTSSRENAPAAITHGKGARVWDLDGNEYIDCSMGSPRSASVTATSPSCGRCAKRRLQGTNFQRPGGDRARGGARFPRDGRRGRHGEVRQERLDRDDRGGQARARLHRAEPRRALPRAQFLQLRRLVHRHDAGRFRHSRRTRGSSPRCSATTTSHRSRRCSRRATTTSPASSWSRSSSTRRKRDFSKACASSAASTASSSSSTR